MRKLQEPSSNINILWLLCLIITVARFAMECYTPSLPFIAKYFHTTHNSVQLTITLYLAGFGISQLIYGPLSEWYGRRKVLLCGFILFMVGNLLCTISSSINILIIARFVAGIGGGVGPALKRAIATDNYKGVALVKAWSVMSSALVVTMIIAPVIGGYVQEFLGWRFNFIIITIYTLLIIVILYFLLPETNINVFKYPLTFTSIIRNYRILLRDKEFIACSLCSTFAATGLVLYFQIAPFIIIDKLKFSASHYGLLSLVIATAYILSGFIVSKFVDILGVYKMLVMGISFLILAGLLMLVFDVLGYFDILTILAPTVVYVVGARIVVPNAAATALSSSSRLSGYASSAMGSIQMLGSAIISYFISLLPRTNQITLSFIFLTLGILSVITLFSLLRNSSRLS